MKFCKIIIVAASVLVLGSCSTSKEIISDIQGLRPGESELTFAAPTEIRIQPKDKLSILVNSQDLRLTNLSTSRLSVSKRDSKIQRPRIGVSPVIRWTPRATARAWTRPRYLTHVGCPCSRHVMGTPAEGTGYLPFIYTN